jgi:dTDP-4-dehydrorhamnose reductase
MVSFLKKNCQGYTNAYFNGLPTYYLSKILLKILSKYNLSGLIHISGIKISKYHLLKKINKIYDKKIKIIPDNTIRIDRTLDNSKLKKIIKFTPRWGQLISKMKQDHEKR